MFPVSYYNDSFWTPSYWVKVGGVIGGHGGNRVGAHRYYGHIIAEMMRRRLQQSVLQNLVLSKVQERITLASSLRQAQYDAVRAYNQRSQEAAAFSILFSEV